MYQGSRVLLRPHRRDDLPLLWKYRTDVEVELAGGGDPPKALMLHQVEAEFEKGEFIFNDGFAMEVDGKYIGFCGIFNFNSLSHTCELGITIGDKDYWSKGYGREAIGLLLFYGFQHRNVRRISLSTGSDNERAIRCYLASGFVEEGRQRQHVWCDGKYVDMVHMGILKAEWEALQGR